MKRKRFWGKEAITPLMTTFLLVSFAVAIGVGVMNFGRAQVEDKAQCPVEVGLKFFMISGKEQLCYDNAKKEIKFTLENGVSIATTGIIVNVIGSEKAETAEFDEAKMSKAGTYVAHVKYDASLSGQVQQIKISPKITPYDQELICQDKALVFEGSINSC